MGYTYDFNVILDRSNERSKTWDPNHLKPGQLPMNGAETHFTCPYPVLDAVRKVSNDCCVYGYPYFTDDFCKAAAGWMKRRHNWDVDYKWVEFVGGIVPGLAFAMQHMTKIGEGVIINTPAYGPFRDCIRDNDRVLVESALKFDSDTGVVEFDWEDMEAKFADPNNTMFILCDPHNPTGKVATFDELKKIEELSKKYNVFVAVDEVHADYCFDHPHICYPTVGEWAHNFSAVVINPSKTFNTAGFRTAAIIIPNQEIHDAVNVKIAAVKGYSRTITGVIAFEAAYGGECDDYADQSKAYVLKMRDKMCDFFAENIPEMKIIKPEGCFVCWCDCRGLGFEDQGEMMKFFADAGVLLGNGIEYDKELGKGWVRIAYGFPEVQLMPALEKLAAAVAARRK